MRETDAREARGCGAEAVRFTGLNSRSRHCLGTQNVVTGVSEDELFVDVKQYHYGIITLEV